MLFCLISLVGTASAEDISDNEIMSLDDTIDMSTDNSNLQEISDSNSNDMSNEISNADGTADDSSIDDNTGSSSKNVLSASRLGASHDLSGSNFTYLQEYFDSGVVQPGDTVYLGGLTYTSDWQSWENKFINVNIDNLIISGGSSANPDDFSTLNGNQGKIFQFTGSGITLQNIKFTNAQTQSSGGAVEFQGSDNKITNCEFTQCQSPMGGAVYASGSSTNTVIENCNFTNNQGLYGSGSGGAVYLAGSGNKITGSTFEGNKVDNGNAGAVYLGGSTEITDCVFRENSASQYGAINSAGDMTLKDCVFESNSASQYGAAGVVGSQGATTVDNCNFTANRGGGIYSGGNAEITNCNFADGTGDTSFAVTSTGIATVNNCNFTNNGGPAINGGSNIILNDCNVNGNGGQNTVTVISNGTATVDNCNFTNNALGGIYSESGVDITDSNFANNGVGSYNSQTVGAVYSGGETRVRNSKFDDNDGGAVHSGGTTDVTNSNFTNNSGGAIYSEGDARIADCIIENHTTNQKVVTDIHGSAIVTNTNFTNNNVTGYAAAGALRVLGDNSQVTYCNFENNTASAAAGIYTSGENTKISNCNFTKNTASNNGDGGAIYNEGKYTQITDCDFIDNQANSGAAIYSYNDGANISNCDFTNNGANSQGGAIFVGMECAGTNIDNCDFTNNSASGWGSGGAIYISEDATDSTISNSNFTGNTAPNGGAISTSGDRTAITNASFENNNATTSGGAIYSNSVGNEITYSNFTSNNAGDGGAIQLGGANNDFDIEHSVFKDNYAHATKNGQYYIDDEGNGIPQYDGGNGGAINTANHEEVNHNILDVTFINNTADKAGGAIKHHSNWTFTDCIFEDNSANPDNNKLFSSDVIDFGGGALWCCDGLSTLVNTNFTNNNATYGGAVRGAVNARDCVFDKNTAFDGNGGGIDMTIEAGLFDDETFITSVHLSDCVFTDNEAKGEYAIRPDAKGGKAQGGAIHSYRIEGMIIDNITCTGNTAFRGGAIDLYEMNYTTITNSTFEYNQATLGGGVAVVGDNCNFTNLTMSSNYAWDGYYDDDEEYLDGQGGGIWVNGSNTLFENSTLESNMATYGGGIMSLGDDGSFVNNSLSYNFALMGGAIAVDSGDDDPNAENITFFNNTITYNQALLGGGGVFVQGDDVNFTDNDISYNEATTGGAFWVYGNNLYVENLTSIENTAQNGGSSAVYSCDGLVVKNSTFIGNTATGDIEVNRGLGGAFHLSDATNVDIQANFYNNTAINGSAIYSEKSTGVYIHDSDFVDNQAYSYLLSISPENNTVLSQNESFNISVTHVGGDNIINAIYNTGGSGDIGFTNVTYPFLTLDGQEIIRNTNDGKDPTEVIRPVIGVENSDNGNLLYQDDLENNQIINVLVKDKNGNLAKDINGRDLNFTGLKSDIYGTVTELIPGLAPGKYFVEAAHPEDTYYKEIYNLTILRIGPTDLEINKTVSDEVCNVSDIVDWNVTTTNNGPLDGLNTTISDLLPVGLNLTNLTFRFYDENNGLWTNGTLDLINNVLYYSVYNETGDNWIDGRAIYDASTHTWTYYVVDLGNNTFAYDTFNPDYFTDMFGEYVYNESTQSYNFVHIIYNESTGNWSYHNLDYNGQNVTYGLFNETYFVDQFGQARYDERTGRWAFDKIAYDPNTGNWSYYILRYNNKDYTYTVFNQDYFTEIFGEYTHDEGSGIWIYENISYDEDTGNWSYYTFYFNGKTINYGGFNESYFVDELGVANYDPNTQIWVFRNITYNENTGNWSYNSFRWDGKTYYYGVFNPDYFTDVLGPYSYDASTNSYIYKEVYYDANNENWNYNIFKWEGNEIKYGVFNPDYFTDVLGPYSYDASTNSYIYRNVTYNAGSENWEYNVFYFNDNGDDHKVTYSAFNPDYFTDLFGEYTYDDGTNTWTYQNASYDGNSGIWIVNGIRQEPKRITMTPELVTINVTKSNIEPDHKFITPNFISIEPEYYTFEPTKITLSINDTSEGKKIALFTSNLTEDSSVVMNLVTNVTKPGKYLNLANVSTDSPERNYTNNYANNTTRTEIDSSLEVIKIANNESVYVGNETSFTIVVINSGSTTLTNVNVTDTDYSQGLEFNGVYSDPNNNWTYHGNGYWTLNNPLPAGENASFTVYFNVTTNGTLVNNVTANSTETNESNATNKTVAYLPNMTVQKIADDEITYVGNTTSFLIVVTNTGDCELGSVTVLDSDYSAGLTFNGTHDSVKGVWSYDPNTKTFALEGPLAVGDYASFRVYFNVTMNGTLVNNVTAKSNLTNETNGTNQTKAYLPNMTVQKIANDEIVYVGNTTSFKIVVTNTGDCNLSEVVVTDVDYTSPGLVYADKYDNSSRLWTYEGNGKWTLVGDLEVGQSAEFTVYFNVTLNGTLVNNVTAKSNLTNETNSSNNTTAYLPNMTVQKIANDEITYVGNVTSFTVVVTNTGDCNLSEVVVTDVDYTTPGLVYAGKYDNSSRLWTYDGAGHWTLVGDLEVGQSAEFTVYFNVTLNGTLVNNVTAKSNLTNETNSSNNTTAYLPNMTVQKIANDEIVYVGNVTSFTVVVTNTGDCNLSDVVVTDVDYTTPGLVYADKYDNSSREWTYDGAGHWTLVGDLEVGQSAEFTVYFNVTLNGTLVNNVTAKSNLTNETNSSNNTTAYLPNMTVQKIANDEITYVGNVTSFTVVVTNTGDCNLSDVVVTDVDYTTPGLVYAGKYDNSSRLWTYDGAGHWTLVGDLEVGQSAEFTVYFNVTATGLLVNNVTATSNLTNETNSSNNTTAYGPDMTVQKITIDEVVYVGNTTSFKIVVTNTGDCNLTGVYVVDTDYTTPGLVYAGRYENSTRLWNYDGNGNWTLVGDLEVGQSAEFTVYFNVTLNGTLVNNVTAGSNETNETNSSNNTTAYLPNMTVQKIANDEIVYVGNTTSFTVVVTNTGDCNLSDVVVTDVDYTTPGLVYADKYDNSSREWTYDGAGHWTLVGDLEVGQSAEFTVYFNVTLNGTLVNNVTAKSNLTNETNSSNNTTAYLPNMTVQKIANDEITYVGNVTSFTVVVTNTGDCNLSDVVVTDVDYTTPGLVYADKYDNSSREWTYDGAGHWTLVGDLEVGQSAEFTVYFNVTATGLLVNNVTATSNLTNETNSSNNTTAYGPDMTVQKITVENVTYVGNTTSFIIVVTNTGDCNLTGVYVVDTDYTTPGLVYAGRYENSTRLWNYDGNGNWTLVGDLEVGQSAEFTVYFNVTLNGTLVNNVTAGSNETNETNSSNNTTAYLPNMTVQKIANDEIVYVGNVTSFTVVVTNTGDCNLSDVVVTDVDYTTPGLVYADKYDNSSREWTYDGAGHWTLVGDLEVGQSAEFSVYFNVTLNGTLVNNVTAKSNLTNETNSSNNTTAYLPNMTVQKISNDESVYVGNITSFTVVVTNTGDCNLSEVVVTDTEYSAGLVYADRYDNSSRLWNYEGNGKWSLVGDLEVGQSAEFTVYFKVLANGTLVNNVTATSNLTNETNSSNNTTAYLPNMTVQKIANEKIVYVGNTTSFTVVVTNTGDCNLSEVVVADVDYSEGLVYADKYDNSSREWTYDGAGHWTLVGDLEVGQSAEFTVYFNVTATGLLVNNVTATSNLTNETNGTNNTTAYGPNMTVQKITIDQVVYVGNTTSFKIVVTNTGDCNLSNVVVTDVDYSEGLVYANKYDNSSREWTYDGAGHWTLVGDLEVGQSAEFTVYFNVTLNGTLVNNVTAKSNETNETNNTNNTTAYKPNMTVVKIANDEIVYVGNTTSFKIVVTNTGDCNLSEVVVTDVDYSEGLVYANKYDNSSREWTYENGRWNLVGDLEVGQSAEFTVYFNVTLNGTLVNNVTATSNLTNETNSSNNTTAYAPNMTVQKITIDEIVYVGNTTSFKIVVTNTGDCNLSDVVVTDVDYSEGLVYADKYDNSSRLWTYDGSGHWTLVGDLEVGQSAEFTVYFNVTATGLLVNNVTADSNLTNETNSSNNTTAYGPNMTVQKITVENVTYVGNTTSFIIVVTNTGDIELGDVTVTDVNYSEGLVYNGTFENVKGTWILTGDRIWTLDGPLAPGESASFKVYFNVTLNGTLVNNVTAKSNLTNETNNTNNTTAYAPNMTVQKISNDEIVYVGNTTSFTIVVTNTGDCNLSEVVVTDTEYSAGLEYADKYDNSSRLWNYEGDGKWSLVGDLEVGQSAEFTVYFKVLTNGTLVNNVTAKSNLTNETNNTNNTTAYAPNMTVQKITIDEIVYVGNTTSFKIVVTNTGDCNLSEVVVTDVDYSEGLVYDKYANSSREWTYDGAGHWTLVGGLEVGQSAEFTVYFNVTSTGLLVNNVTADSNLTNETNNTNNTTAYAPNMTVQKVTLDQEVYVGNTTRFTIVVENTGDCVLDKVYVVDTDYDHTALSYLRYENGSRNWNYDDNGNWTLIGTLAVGEKANFTVWFEVLTNGTFVNNVTAGSNLTNETNNTNNTTGKPICDLAITKIVNTTHCYVDDLVEWNITVVNRGPSTALDVIVKDVLPEGLKLVDVRGGTYDNDTHEWIIGTLDKNQSVSIVLVTQVLINGTIRNNASVNTTINETNYTNNNATNVTEADYICDLVITKAVNCTSCYVSDVVEWNITVVNVGPHNATNVIVKDILPKGMELISYRVSVGNFNEVISEWSIGTLEKDTPVSLVLVTKVLIDGTFVNIATVNTTTPESNYTNNEANNTTRADPICDLVIVKVVDSKKVYLGEIVSWTIKVTNNGPSEALNVKVSDILPDGLILINYKASKGKYVGGVWTVGKLASGASATITLKTNTSKVGNITNPASVNTTTHESNYTNNDDNDTTEVLPYVDLVLTKSSDKPKYNVNDTMHWIIKVVNNGPCDAIDAYVLDVLPSSTKFVSYTSSKGSFDAATGVWKIGDLANGEEAVIDIVCIALSAGNFTNNAIVNNTIKDVNTSNNLDNATIEVVQKDEPVPEPTPNPEPVPPVHIPKTGNPLVVLLIALMVICGSALRCRKE